MTQTARKQIAKLVGRTAKRIRDYLRGRLAGVDDPRSLGSALKAARLGEFWKYRVGDCWIISQIEDGKLTILIVRIRNRPEV